MISCHASNLQNEPIVYTEADLEGGIGFRGLTPPPPRTAQLIVKFGEKVLQIDYRYCK